MPSKARIISRSNSPKWDDLVRAAQKTPGVEWDYFGCANEGEANDVRMKLRTAAKHQGAGSKVYYRECPQPGACQDGGRDCQYHVYYTTYDLDAARKYKADQSSRR